MPSTPAESESVFGREASLKRPEVSGHCDWGLGCARLPAWLACLAAASSIRFSERGRRLLKASHFANSTEEMKRFYFDVLNTAERLGVSVPHLASLRERIDHRAT